MGAGLVEEDPRGGRRHGVVPLTVASPPAPTRPARPPASSGELQQDLDTLTRRTADPDRRPGWADEQLAALRALQQSVDVLARRDAERATAANAGCTAHLHSGQLRRDLVDLVAFLDHRLPGRGPTHDRFAIPALEPEPSA
jgi:hypothetical protein